MLIEENAAKAAFFFGLNIPAADIAANICAKQFMRECCRH